MKKRIAEFAGLTGGSACPTLMRKALCSCGAGAFACQPILLRLLSFAILLALPLAAAIREPIQVEGGLVSGTPGWAWGVRQYRGIPFAAPPVGNRRWRPPQPVIPWQGVRAADQFSAACMQGGPGWTAEQIFDPGLRNRSEDCLYLNVWTPAASAGERLPVLVWIHAGAGIMGSAARPLYDGAALAKKGVVVVSANYRLGVFGWFAHPELTAESEHRSSGNYGALDQLAALQWVQKNIAQFGGDPTQVTMFGQSAGCGAVNTLAASPLVKGLVRGGIAESCAVFLARIMTLPEAENMGAQFAKAIGKPTLAALRAMPAQELLDASIGSSAVNNDLSAAEAPLTLSVPINKTPAAPRSAIVDGWFLPQDIYTTYSQGKQNDISLLTGNTNDEGPQGEDMGSGGAAPPNTVAAYTAWVKQIFGAKADALLRLYPASTGAEAARAWHDLRRDIVFATHRAWAQAAAGKSPVYLYRFSHVPPHPEGNGNNPPAPVGTLHSSEILYVFDNLRVKDYPWTDVDRRIADMLSSYWTNFAKTSNPNGPGLASWPAYNPKDEYLMNFGDTFKLERFNAAAVDLIAAAKEELRRSR
jgi:para-nitrobenzyl esterase